VVGAFLDRCPEVQVDLVLLDRVVDLIEEGFDIAVRIGHLPDSSLIVRKVASVRRVVCASAGYLRRAGVPESPRDLAGHDIVAFTGLDAVESWRFRQGNRTVTIPIKPRLSANQADVAIAAALAGQGITRVLSYQLALAPPGRLRLLLEQFEPEALPVQLVYPAHRLIAPSVRAFVDAAAERLTRLGSP
jgi:DNA-binding transcriptional LysR family regulator